jgi:hypothetical protein
MGLPPGNVVGREPQQAVRAPTCPVAFAAIRVKDFAFPPAAEPGQLLCAKAVENSSDSTPAWGKSSMPRAIVGLYSLQRLEELVRLKEMHDDIDARTQDGTCSAR